MQQFQKDMGGSEPDCGTLAVYTSGAAVMHGALQVERAANAAQRTEMQQLRNGERAAVQRLAHEVARLHRTEERLDAASNRYQVMAYRHCLLLCPECCLTMLHADQCRHTFGFKASSTCNVHSS